MTPKASFARSRTAPDPLLTAAAHSGGGWLRVLTTEAQVPAREAAYGRDRSLRLGEVHVVSRAADAVIELRGVAAELEINRSAALVEPVSTGQIAGHDRGDLDTLNRQPTEVRLQEFARLDVDFRQRFTEVADTTERVQERQLGALRDEVQAIDLDRHLVRQVLLQKQQLIIETRLAVDASEICDDQDEIVGLEPRKDALVAVLGLVAILIHDQAAGTVDAVVDAGIDASAGIVIGPHFVVSAGVYVDVVPTPGHAGVRLRIAIVVIASSPEEIATGKAPEEQDGEERGSDTHAFG